MAMTTEGCSPEETGKHLARMISVTIGGGGDGLLRAMQAAVRQAGGDPAMFRRKGDADASWVLVKGYHDSGTIDGVFGPYTEAYADWLLGSMLDCSTYNWTKSKLKSEREES